MVSVILFLAQVGVFSFGDALLADLGILSKFLFLTQGPII